MATAPAERLRQAIVDAVRQAESAAIAATSPQDRARALSALLGLLQEQVVAVTAERDQALIELLGQPSHPSHRSLAADLGMSRQRVDQLAEHARAGGRPRRAGS